MADRQTSEHIQQTGATMKRRSILAVAGAVVAGIVAKQTSAPVAAVTYNLQGDTGLSIVNVAHDRALVIATGTFPASTPVFDAELTGGSFTIGSDLAVGVKGASNRDAGVWGVCSAANKPGVYGTSISSRTGIGVRGEGDAAGVIGQSSIGIGVQGSVPGSNFTNTVAVQGLNQSTGASGIGVSGQCDTATGIGVKGASNLGVGVFGASNGNAGVLGISTAPGNVGVGGIANVAGTAAFAGTSTNPSAFAGFFTGDVFVNGNFTVQDPTRKHGAIAHPDGSNRILYSMESPESWLEDFGKGQLTNGSATVTLDPDFAAVVQTGDYRVFITPLDDCKGLYATALTAAGFAVREMQGGVSGTAFHWRVVAKPKTTNKAPRMAKVVIPDIKVPQPPPMATMPTAKAPDASPQAQPPSRAASPAASPSQGSGVVQAGTTSPVLPVPPPRSG